MTNVIESNTTTAAPKKSIAEMRFGNPTFGSEARPHTDKSTAIFRLWLNERCFPLNPPAKATPDPAAVRLAAELDARREAQLAEIRKIRAMYRLPFSDQPVKREEGRGYYHNGFPTKAPAAKVKAPSPHRPESANVVWKTWLADGERELVLVAHKRKGQVITTDGDTEVTRATEVTDYWVTLAETRSIPLDTDEALASANAMYYRAGVPMTFKTKSWRVLEPVEEAIGPFSSLDDAERAMTAWASEINDDFRDHHNLQDDTDPWTRDGQ